MPKKKRDPLKIFGYKQLPPRLQAISRPLCEAAGYLVSILPDCHERQRALDLLMDAKNWAVLAALEDPLEELAERLAHGTRTGLLTPHEACARYAEAAEIADDEATTVIHDYVLKLAEAEQG
ncbi:MAG: hypothetical protein ACYTFG_00165 [Planctomycetota bacterium]|jgi:hypothetical protein